MQNWWIRFGCFLTGYNYGIVRNSSEVAAKSVKRYTSAVLIVCILWAFVGYTFTERYLHGGTWGSVAGALVLVVIVIQIERQIILSINPTRWLYLARGVIAITMAIIGAVIIDQIIFKEDIELEKISFLGDRVKKALPPRTEELKNQLASLDTAVEKKENERLALIADIERNPTIKAISSQQIPNRVTETTRDSSGQIRTVEKIKTTTAISVTNSANPKIAMLLPLEQNIKALRDQKGEKEQSLLNVRTELENEIRSKVGFLDELKVMFKLITDSNIALGVWLLWFGFLIGLECLVLISKINEKENDYEKRIKHHMELQIRKLAALARMAEGN